MRTLDQKIERIISIAQDTGTEMECNKAFIKGCIEEIENELIDKVLYKLWEFREFKSMEIESSYAACNSIYKIIVEFKK